MAKAVNIARSHRLDGIGEYYFSRRLREIAEIEAATGRQIVKLAMGSPDLPPHQSVIDRLAKEAQRPDVHKYMSYKGEPILRKAFADWYKKWYRTELDYNSEVLPLIGSKEGIMHICMTFLNKGDKVLVPNPGYPTYSAAVRLAGGEMVTYALNKENEFPPRFRGNREGRAGRCEDDADKLPQHADGTDPDHGAVPADRGFRRQAQHTDRARQPL